MYLFSFKRETFRTCSRPAPPQEPAPFHAVPARSRWQKWAVARTCSSRFGSTNDGKLMKPLPDGLERLDFFGTRRSQHQISCGVPANSTRRFQNFKEFKVLNFGTFGRFFFKKKIWKTSAFLLRQCRVFRRNRLSPSPTYWPGRDTPIRRRSPLPAQTIRWPICANWPACRAIWNRRPRRWLADPTSVPDSVSARRRQHRRITARRSPILPRSWRLRQPLRPLLSTSASTWAQILAPIRSIPPPFPPPRTWPAI